MESKKRRRLVRGYGMEEKDEIGQKLAARRNGEDSLLTMVEKQKEISKRLASRRKGVR